MTKTFFFFAQLLNLLTSRTWPSYHKATNCLCAHQPAKKINNHRRLWCERPDFPQCKVISSQYNLYFILFHLFCPFFAQSLREVGRFCPKPKANHTGWMTVGAPTDRPKSIHNRCVIDHFHCICVTLTIHLPFWGVIDILRRRTFSLFSILSVYIFPECKRTTLYILFRPPSGSQMLR